jgi:hypothetical protein
VIADKIIKVSFNKVPVQKWKTEVEMKLRQSFKAVEDHWISVVNKKCSACINAENFNNFLT